MSRALDGFRFTTLALALTPLLPILGESTRGAAAVISLVGLLRWHAQEGAGMGALLWLGPSVAALVSLFVPSRRRRARAGLAAASLAVACFEMGLVMWPGSFGAALGVGLLIPASGFARHALMMLFFTFLWLWIEIRPPTEDAP